MKTHDVSNPRKVMDWDGKWDKIAGAEWGY
jgi:hypothetical protein